jgi:hypothetical protein
VFSRSAHFDARFHLPHHHHRFGHPHHHACFKGSCRAVHFLNGDLFPTCHDEINTATFPSVGHCNCLCGCRKQTILHHTHFFPGRRHWAKDGNFTAVGVGRDRDVFPKRHVFRQQGGGRGRGRGGRGRRGGRGGGMFVVVVVVFSTVPFDTHGHPHVQH